MTRVQAAIANQWLALSADERCRRLACAAFLAHLTLNFVRGPEALLEPSLAYEDGRDIFAFYYNQRDPTFVLRSFAGYISLVPNLIGYLVLALDGRGAALVLRILPWLLNALALSLFVLPPWRSIVASDRLRFMLSLSLAALPLQDFGMVTMTMYSLWSLLLIQCWLGALPAPRANAALALSLGVQCGAAWSNPLSVLLLPLYGLRAFAGRRERRQLVACALPALATLVYYAVGVAPERNPLASDIASQVVLAIDYAVQRVCFELLGSSEVRVWLHHGGLDWVPRVVGMGFALLFCGSVSVLWRRGVLSPGTRSLCLAALYLVPCATLLFVVARDPGQEAFVNGFGQRYFFLQKVSLVLAGVCVVADVVATSAWRPSRGIVCGFAAAAVAYLALLNGLDRELYQGLPQEFARTRAFLARLHHAERVGGHERVSLERGEWTLLVTAR